MPPLPKSKKSRKANLEKANAVNPFHPRQLRSYKLSKNQKKKTALFKSQPKPTDEIPSVKEFDRQKHMESISKIAVENRKRKIEKFRENEKRRIKGIKAGAWSRQKSIPREDVEQPSTSSQITPEKVLATKRQARLSNEGYRRVNNLVSAKFDAPLTLTWQLEKARKNLEKSIKYSTTELEDICLESVVETMEERRNRLELDIHQGRRVVFSLDKGHGRVTSTVSFVHHPKPNSCYNHLPLQVWQGSDSYDTLKEHCIGKAVEDLSKAGYVFFHGGDLSYLSTVYGLNCSMTFPCLWCSKRFVRGAAADKNSIDFVVYKDRSEPAVEEEIKSFKFSAPKAPLIPIPRDFVVPPVLHFKIKVGNELFSRLLNIAGQSPIFQRVLKNKNLDVDRHKEGVIYSRFNGNDIKRLCDSIEDLAVVSDDDDFQRVVKVLRTFSIWCRLVSTTDTDLTDEHIQKICCRGAHHEDSTCCQTAILGKDLEMIGGFGSSGLVHVMVMHLGPFVWKHRLIGAVVEEGIESVHSKIATELQRHKHNQLERIKYALKWLAIDVLLSDKNLFDR